MTEFRKQTYELDCYLRKLREKEIRNDTSVGRHFVWGRKQINELIATVILGEYMPPVILGRDENKQFWVLDGSQRSSALNQFRHGNYKISAATGDSLISYRRKVRDKNGKIKEDSQGNAIWEDALFDIKNKTYEKLPEELKKKFQQYEMECVIYENCDAGRISRYVQRYNSHTAMNTRQKAFAQMDSFAPEIRKIADSSFFRNCSAFTEKEKTKGIVECVVVQTMVCSYYPRHWDKHKKTMCKYLETHVKREEFQRLRDELHRLEAVVTEDIRDFFNSRNAVCFLTLFHRFTKLGLNDCYFAEFLRRWKELLASEAGEKVRWDGKEDNKTVFSRLEMLEKRMNSFLKAEKWIA